MPSVDSVELNSNDSITPAMDFQFGRQRIRNNISTKSDGILLLSSDVLSTETNREIIPAAALAASAISTLTRGHLVPPTN